MAQKMSHVNHGLRFASLGNIQLLENAENVLLAR